MALESLLTLIISFVWQSGHKVRSMGLHLLYFLTPESFAVGLITTSYQGCAAFTCRIESKCMRTILKDRTKSIIL